MQTKSRHLIFIFLTAVVIGGMGYVIAQTPSEFGHPPSQIGPGTFYGGGDYIFPATSNLVVQGNLNVNGNIGVAGKNNVDVHFPDGLDGEYKNLRISSSETYTVPMGKTLYIMTASSQATSDLKITGSSYYHISGPKGISFESPFIVPGGETLDAPNTMYLTGIEVDTSVTPKAFMLSTGTSYTVPVGKTLFIHTIYAIDDCDITIDGSRYFHVLMGSDSLANPLVIKGGQIVSSNPDPVYVTGYEK